jgi:ABC-type antimicrobial peptide transport system permease subunit
MASMLEVQDGFALIFIVVVFLLLSFGLANTLLMAIFERVREIGLMQALGMRPVLVLWQILLESLFLLLLGLAVGIGLGMATVLLLADGLDLSAVAEGMALMSVGSVLYPLLMPGDVLLTVVVVLVMGMLTSVLPAWRAARLRPVQALGWHG